MGLRWSAGREHNKKISRKGDHGIVSWRRNKRSETETQGPTSVKDGQRTVRGRDAQM